MGWFSKAKQDEPPQKTKTPFPTKQMFILGLCRICEPIAYMSIFPYVYYMIQSFHIASSDDKIAAYAGMVTSAFALAEFSCAVPWGRLSDVIGRKPVLLCGLAGTGLSMLMFGLSKSFPMLLISRALGGALNGNIGVIQTTVAEVIRGKEEHQARAYAIVPFVWTVGGILGSSLGGLLAMPVQNYPEYFNKGTVWDEYPFLLPNLVCAAVVVAGLVIGTLFLEETHEQHQYRRDYGLEAGKYLTSLIWTPKRPTTSSSTASGDEPSAANERTPLLGSSRSSTLATSEDDDPEHQKPATQKPSFASAFTKPVVLQIIAYGFIAFHTATFGQLFPVLLSMPESQRPTHLPFHFEGGFGLPAKTIGVIYALQGFYTMFFQVVVFPAAINRWGTHRLYRFLIFTFAILYVLTPYTVLLQGDTAKLIGMTVLVMLHISYGATTYPSNALLLANSAPSLMVLGSINGVAASMAALCRACGPTVSGWLQSVGLERGVMGLGWWSAALVAALGGIEAIWLEDPDVWNKDAQKWKSGGDEGDGTAKGVVSVSDVVTANGAAACEPVSASESGAASGTLLENQEIAILAVEGGKGRDTHDDA